MARRIVILIMILFKSDFPYGLFAFISFFTTPPKYYLRIVFVFVNLSLTMVMISVFQFTDKLNASVMKLLKYRPNVIIAPIT
ncbi:unnamed protein product [Adineta steineri]|uniref:Uncharacterized protein n=1 Tax=Adineta steineri TaxID=433720 RepID=A0A814JDY8_9BILA|nr:unnamed protein product [Adineta steineri]CAF1035527.1 unnamed protein product [Adineta steineri]CAF1108247.1 unnamed protein product [Adineta steineri]CAF4186361.1 unnamed protein product [Adineta steineri]CAF4253678.1 unnamed protein product [Adineta steineri]